MLSIWISQGMLYQDPSMTVLRNKYHTHVHIRSFTINVNKSKMNTDLHCFHSSHFEKVIYKPFPKRQILDWSKLKEFADNNFKFDANSIKVSKRVENTVAKGEIARYEEFLLFPQCFQKTCTADK